MMCDLEHISRKITPRVSQEPGLLVILGVTREEKTHGSVLHTRDRAGFVGIVERGRPCGVRREKAHDDSVGLEDGPGMDSLPLYAPGVRGTQSLVVNRASLRKRRVPELLGVQPGQHRCGAARMISMGM